MKVFISWSGTISNQIAAVIAAWIPDLIQGTDVFLSSEDIAKGERNAKSMWDALDGYEFGLSIVTAQNKTAPWIMFEAGVMMRFTTGRVIPILCNLDRLDIANTPLNSFQCSSLQKIDMRKVAKSINEAANSPLSPDQLTRAFDLWWPNFEAGLAAIDMTVGLESQPAPLDQSEHFKRLENGITSIMSMVDRLHKDASIERAEKNLLMQLTEAPEYNYNFTLNKSADVRKMKEFYDKAAKLKASLKNSIDGPENNIEEANLK